MDFTLIEPVRPVLGSSGPFALDRPLPPARPYQPPNTLLPIPRSAHLAREALLDEVARVVPGATVASPRVVDAVGDTVVLSAMLITIQEGGAFNETARPYRFVLEGGRLTQMEPAQHFTSLMPRATGSMEAK